MNTFSQKNMNLLLSHFPRYYSGLPCILVLLTVLLLAPDAGANQEAQGQSCPAAGEVHSELVTRKDNLIKLKTGLEAFMTGKRVTGIPMTALFMIDPSDVNAVSQRVEELRQDSSHHGGCNARRITKR